MHFAHIFAYNLMFPEHIIKSIQCLYGQNKHLTFHPPWANT